MCYISTIQGLSHPKKTHKINHCRELCAAPPHYFTTLMQTIPVQPAAATNENLERANIPSFCIFKIKSHAIFIHHEQRTYRTIKAPRFTSDVRFTAQHLPGAHITAISGVWEIRFCQTCSSQVAELGIMCSLVISATALDVYFG